MDAPFTYKLYIRSDTFVVNNETDGTKTNITFEHKPFIVDTDKKTVFGKRDTAASHILFNIKKNGDNITVENMYCFKTFTIQEMKMAIAYAMKINISELSITYNVFDNVIPENKEITKTPVFLNIVNTSQKNEFDGNLSIGSSELHIVYTPNNDSKQNNYDTVLYSNYKNTITYIYKCLETARRNNIENITFSPSYKNVTVSMVYLSDGYSPKEINIVKLFNMCNLDESNKWKRVCIHDSSLDDYMSTPREMQYVKAQVNTLEPFKNVLSRFNCCSLYYGLELAESIILSRIEIMKNMIIKCVFTVSNPGYILDDIKNEIYKMYSKNGKMLEIVKKLQLEECIYDIDFKLSNFIPIYTNYASSYMLENCNVKDLNKVYELVNIDVPTTFFKTNSSIYYYGPTVASIASLYEFDYTLTFHNFVTNITLRGDILNRVHITNYDKNTLMINVINAYTFDDILLNMLMIIPLIKTFVPKDTGPVSSITRIRNKYLKIGTKQLIKMNAEIDPTFFGPRIVKDVYRPYSSLAQKREQRVVPITQDEYLQIYKEYQSSCIDIRNQTNPDQRLYLFCPYTSYPFLNFHYLHNQLCIPKCTAKPTNRTQFTVCAQQLAAEGYKQYALRDYSNMVVFYNPILTPGRKCRVPQEFTNVLTNYILYKPQTQLNIYTYCQNTYKLEPFVIRRDVNEDYYHVLTEYDDSINFVLVLQSEYDDMYYIFIDEETSKPLLFNENIDIKEFFKANNSKQKMQYGLFNYIEHLLKLKIKDMYATSSLKDILITLNKKHDIKYVINIDTIVGIVYKNVLYFTPKLYWKFNNSDNIGCISIFKVFGGFSFPKISIFEQDKITHYYRDYTTMKITMIRYMDVDTLVEPSDIILNESKNVIIYDHEGYISKFENINFKKKFNVKNAAAKLVLLKNILYTYIYIYMGSHDTFLPEELKEQLINMNIVTDNASYQKYTDKYNTYISWRNAKMTKEEYKDAMDDIGKLTYDKIIKIVYDQLRHDMEFKQYKHIEEISSKIITINT